MAIVAGAAVDVGASPERTFAVLSDASRFHEWQGGMQPARVDPGPIGPGSRLTARRTWAGMAVTFTSEVTRWEPPRRLSFRSVRTPLRVTGDYRVAPTAGGCRVEATLEIGVPRIGPIRLGSQAEPVIARQLQTDLETLADLVVAGTEPTGQEGPGT